MNKKYTIIGLLVLIVLGLGCIGNNSTNSPTTKSVSNISSRLASSEQSGIFSEMMKTSNHGCANKYSATFNDGDYLEIQWDNHNSPCENNLSDIYYSIDYISGNDSYKLSYNSGIKGDNVSFNDFSKDVIKRYNLGELSNRDKEIYADFNNISDVGKFVIKISGTDGVRFTGTINGMTDGYIPVKKLDDTIPKEISVDNLKSMSLKKLNIGLMKVDIIKDNKLVFSNYINNHGIPNMEYSSNPGYLKEDMPPSG